jgi:hypothetical protein
MSGIYYEDIFVKFVSRVLNDTNDIDGADLDAMISFSSMIQSQESFTSKQASYALRMMEKYAEISHQQGFEIKDRLNQAEWKNSFRILDTTKKVWVDHIDDRCIICLKFPYEYKGIFDKHAFVSEGLTWDKEKKISTISVYKTRLLILHDILEKNYFEMDDSYLNLIALLETALDNEDNIVPHCLIENDKVVLKNATENARDFWEKNKIDEIAHDLLTAKQMGFGLKNANEEEMIKKIARSKSNKFWTSDFDRFLSLCEKISGTKVVFIGGHREYFEHLRNFIASLERSSIPLNKVKVCFRESGEQGKIFNDWIRKKSLGGKIGQEEILIFKDKIPKWLISNDIDVKIIGINELYPITNRYTRIWSDSHHCVIYLGEFKASAGQGETIVSL